MSTRLIRSRQGKSSHWDLVISDAERQLKAAQEKVKKLEFVLVELKRMKESGEKWPTTNGESQDVKQTKN